MTAPLARASLGTPPFELDAMASARRYQEWVFDLVRPHLGGCILEIGSGIGTMTSWLVDHAPTVATDIDPDLLQRLTRAALHWDAPPLGVHVFDIANDEIDGEWLQTIDTVISFNVLEHIPDDVAAVRGMLTTLRASRTTATRRLIIFVPAHPWAYGTIDETFRHCRRYSKRGLITTIATAHPGAARIHLRYFNTLGLPGWVMLGRVLKRPTFGTGSVAAMERLVPVFRRLDRLFHGRRDLPFGQSLLCVIELL